MHTKFMLEALADAKAALKRGEFPVGCIVVHNNDIIARGRRAKSTPGGSALNEIYHAEMVALGNLAEIPPQKISRASLTLYTTFEPCIMCASAIIINKIPRVVYAYEDADGGGSALFTKKFVNSLKPYYRSLPKVTVESDIMRNESLELFHNFFEEADNEYLSDSFLREYTAEQSKRLK